MKNTRGDFINLNINVNETYTYPQLCGIFGEDKTTGKAKINQLKRFQRYVELNKINGTHKYKIIKIRDKPLLDNKSRQSKFSNELKVLIFNLLYTKSQNIYNNTVDIDLTLNEWIIMLSLINRDLFYELLKNQRVDNNQNLKIFSSTAIEIIKSSVRNAFISLRSFAEVNDRYVVLFDYNDYKNATKQEIATIVNCENNVAKDMGYKDRISAIKSKPKEFYNKATEMFNYSYPNYIGYRKQIQIISHKETLTRNISEYTALKIDMPVGKLTHNDICQFINTIKDKYFKDIFDKCQNKIEVKLINEFIDYFFKNKNLSL